MGDERWEKCVKGATLVRFHLKERFQIFEMCRYQTVLRFLLNLCRRPAIRFGLARDKRSPHRNPRFASFLADSNQQYHADMHDAVLRGRKIVRQLLLLALAGGGAWVVVESARALSVF